MVLTAASLQLSQGLGLGYNHNHPHSRKSRLGLRTRTPNFSLFTSSSNPNRLSFRRQDSSNVHLSDIIVHRPLLSFTRRHNAFKCHSFLPSELPGLKTAAVALTRSFDVLRSSPHMTKLAVAAAVTIFAAWGVVPLIRLIRNLILQKSDNSWKKSNTNYIMTSYLQPMLLWTGALLICRALDPLVLPTEASQVVKQRLLNFVRSLSTVLAFAYCLSSVIQQTQKFFMETNNDPSDTRNMGFHFAGKAVYSAVWIAAFSLFMELLGFSTQKWVTAGGLGTVLLTLAGREIFTNFLSSAMIHATRPFVANEWIQTKIEGYEVSGTVEHVGWWSPTIVRGEDREAVHIPNHKFTVNVVRNLTQKTHWRIKTHLAISHLDVHKINYIVADMRKVLAKNPQVEQQRLHRRVFLENVNAENQALMILISCFVKTSHFEEYLCVKEAILLDLLRVISHHRARLATPIRTVQKIYSDADLENIPFADAVYSRSGVPNRPLLLIEPAYKINGEDKTKSRTNVARPTVEKDGKTTARPPSPDNKVDAKVGATPSKESPASDNKAEEPKENPKTGDPKTGNKVASKSISKTDSKVPLPEAEPDAYNNNNNNGQLGSSLDSSTPKAPNNKQTKNASSENQKSSNTPTPTSSEIVSEKAGGSPMPSSSSSQTKQDSERTATVPKASTSKPVLEENIVLGVALEGSKRTLPIEEDMIPEMAGCVNGQGSPTTTTTSDKDKKDAQIPFSPSSTSVEP